MSCARRGPHLLTASCHKTYFGEVHQPLASYFAMRVGAVADVQVASPPRACHRWFLTSIPYSSARAFPFSLQLGVVVIVFR
jgi:hypothetical protein